MVETNCKHGGCGCNGANAAKASLHHDLNTLKAIAKSAASEAASAAVEVYADQLQGVRQDVDELQSGLSDLNATVEELSQRVDDSTLYQPYSVEEVQDGLDNADVTIVVYLSDIGESDILLRCRKNDVQESVDEPPSYYGWITKFANMNILTLEEHPEPGAYVYYASNKTIAGFVQRVDKK